MSHNKAIQVLKKDPKLAKVIKSVGKYQLKTIRNHYESLVEAIITQQLTGFAAKSISRRFRALYSTRFPKPVEVIKTPNVKLRKIGLSKMKISYIKDLSKKIETNEIKLRTISRLSDSEVISHLTRVKGIGQWTAEMFLIFSLKRIDILPIGDLGLRKGIQFLYSLPTLPTENEVKEIAEKWRPYRTIATWYLWKSLKKFDTIG